MPCLLKLTLFHAWHSLLLPSLSSHAQDFLLPVFLLQKTQYLWQVEMCLDRENAQPTKCPSKPSNSNLNKSCKYASTSSSSCKHMTSRPRVERAPRDVSKCHGDPQKCLCNDDIIILEFPKFWVQAKKSRDLFLRHAVVEFKTKNVIKSWYLD